MAKIHITLQGKGGVGKSFISATTAQYKPHCALTLTPSIQPFMALKLSTSTIFKS
jgi:anion-transporting  ArsA/GET3 family ATPase